LAGLEGFDPKKAYSTEDYTPEQMKGVKLLSKKNTDREMGVISNLVTDMTIQNASDDEMVRAVKHAQVIIDAAKHELDYTRSYSENGIAELKKKYQKKPNGSGGATTLLSRNKSPVDVPKRRGSYKIDPETGEKTWNLSDSRRFNSKTGEYEPYTQKEALLALTKDAHDLSTGTQIEEVYANHSNIMKAMANQARLSSIGLKTDYSNEAAKTYASEVASIKSKLNMSLANAPRERQAQRISSVNAYEKIKAGNLYGRENKKERSKIQAQTLSAARAKIGAHRVVIDLTPKEWEAIQAGAIHDTTLQKVLNYCDDKKIKQLAMPKSNGGMTNSKIAMAKALANRGYTLAQISEQLGFSTTTISKAIAA